jgi:hypothetical protein
VAWPQVVGGLVRHRWSGMGATQTWGPNLPWRKQGMPLSSRATPLEPRIPQRNYRHGSPCASCLTGRCQVPPSPFHQTKLIPTALASLPCICSWPGRSNGLIAREEANQWPVPAGGGRGPRGRRWLGGSRERWGQSSGPQKKAQGGGGGDAGEPVAKSSHGWRSVQGRCTGSTLNKGGEKWVRK